MLVECVDGFTDEQGPSASPSTTSFCPAPPTPTLHQACQAAIDQIEKRNETFKAAVQSPEGDPQEQEVNAGSVFLPTHPPPPPHLEPPASHRTDFLSQLYLASLEGGGMSPITNDPEGSGEAPHPSIALLVETQCQRLPH